MKKAVNFILLVCLTVGILRCSGGTALVTKATTISEIEAEINKHQQELEERYGVITDLEAEQDLILEKMEDMQSEIQNTMASIGFIQSEISEKEQEITEKENEIDLKQQQIDETIDEYNAAKDREEKQRLDMAARTRMMYEQGQGEYMNAILGGDGLSDVLNRLDYIEKVYEYSKMMLDNYILTKNQIQDLWELLEQEEAELEDNKTMLVEARNDLKRQEDDLQKEKDNLNVLLKDLKRQSANYDAEISKYQREADAIQKQLKKDKQTLKDMQAAQAAAQAAANGNYTSNYDSIIDKSAGTDLGRKVAKYACQYIGNPYVSGGTSLTNGADCSGFTYAVYKNFGYSIPRTSYLQRSAGTGVSYENIQVGDLVCYDGHVAMYIGGGLIVHASNSNPYPRGGIKVSNANYRTILAVRRIL